jgi:hypothetical protein
MEIKYNPNNSGRPDSYGDGIKFEDFVAKVIWEKYGIKIEYYRNKYDQYNKGESKQGFEVKFDGTCIKTERLSIEIAEKTNGNNIDWIDSGIYRKDNTINYIQGNYTIIYIFSKRLLQILHEKNIYEKAEWPKDLPTVKKFYLPFTHADFYCDKKIIL